MTKDLRKPEVRQWIKEHEHDEPAQLMLQAHQFLGIPVKEAVAQIQARQKAKKKLPAWYANEEIIYPPQLSVEQASSEETALYKAKLVEGETLADLTGGMGVDVYYLSQSFKKAFYVEQQDELVEVARYNFQVLGVSHVKAVHDTAEHFLDKLQEQLSCIYLDPARRGEHQQKLYKLADCSPDVTVLLPDLLKKARQVLIKAAPMLDISQGLQELTHVKEVHVVAVRNEVKELLFLLDATYLAQPEIKTINFTPGGQEILSFYQEEEQEAETVFGEPLSYLYEPNGAVMKAGAFKLISQNYKLQKLHPNSHLYTSASLVKDFPGRVFEVTSVIKVDKKALKKVLPDSKANLSTRNFPMHINQLRKKLDLREGGDAYVFATTLTNNKPILVIGRKV